MVIELIHIMYATFVAGWTSHGFWNAEHAIQRVQFFALWICAFGKKETWDRSIDIRNERERNRDMREKERHSERETQREKKSCSTTNINRDRSTCYREREKEDVDNRDWEREIQRNRKEREIDTFIKETQRDREKD